MRILLVATLVLIFGCSNDSSKVQPVPSYEPATFRETISKLVTNNQYDDAIKYLKSADPKRQAIYDKEGFCAVGEDLIVLPGVDIAVSYDNERDWFIPGTSDFVIHEGWQRAATQFAEEYNKARRQSD